MIPEVHQDIITGLESEVDMNIPIKKCTLKKKYQQAQFLVLQLVTKKKKTL